MPVTKSSKTKQTRSKSPKKTRKSTTASSSKGPTVVQTTRKFPEDKDVVEEHQLPADKLHKPDSKEADVKSLAGSVIVKFNHYKSSFPIFDGRLTFKSIDDEYCISFAYKGNFRLHINDVNGQPIPENAEGFVGCKDGEIYHLIIEEDPVEVAKSEQKFSSAQSSSSSNCSGPVIPKKGQNCKVNGITNELKGMSLDELRERGDKYKELIEARDLEEILFS